MKWKYIARVLLVLGGLASIVAIIGFFWSTPFYKEKKIKIDCYTERMLSFGTKVDSLTVRYKGEVIDDVWKLRFVLNNVGMQSVIGSGSSSVLLNNQLVINIDSNYHIISYNINKNDFEANYNQLENSFIIEFRKWKPKEKMQIEVLLTPKNNTGCPLVTVDEREVTGAKLVFNNVDYAKIEDFSDNLDWLTNLKLNYPKFIFKIAKWFGLAVFVLLILTPIVLLVRFIDGKIKYGKWKKMNWKKFLKELENSEIPKEERQQYKTKPYNVPKEFHKQFTSIPEAPDPESIGEFILMLIFCTFLLCPFVVYALFAWINL